jgi:D-ribose pyranase
MLRTSLLNSDIISVLSRMGHTDTIVIADCGLPVPDHVQRIDLAIKQGSPSFREVFEAVMQEMKVEKMVVAEEMRTHNPELDQYIRLADDILLTPVSHDDFKEETRQAKAVIRTGENTPYANVILQAGVIF